MPSSFLRPRLRAVLAGTALTAGTVLALAPSAHATTPQQVATQQTTTTHQSSDTRSSQLTPRQRFNRKADRVLHVASNQQGDPYQYGAAGPNSFDCSGLVYYTFRRALGRTLPRVANDQKRASQRVWHRRNLRPGDLVFETDSSGYAYHVGIYAGHGYFWHAPHSGSHVRRQKMYPAHWAFGRIIKSG